MDEYVQNDGQDMERHNKRRRGSVIIESERGIVLVASSSGFYMVPGGGAKRHEPRIVTAIRELWEETGLVPHFIMELFETERKYSIDKVYYVKARGYPKPHNEITSVCYYDKNNPTNIKIARSAQETLNMYYEFKDKNKALFEELEKL